MTARHPRDLNADEREYHTKSETTWMVLNGRARFIGCGDTVLAELGPMEGILVPGGSRYRFSKIGDEDLEILQMVAVRVDSDSAAERINVETHKEWMVSPGLTKYET
jgi:mannose-6-phosphate isomerase-like protein (cupin superfamily)